MEKRNRLLALSVFLVMVFLSVGQLSAKSYYYYETFNNASGTLDTNGWNLSFYMSREFWVSNVMDTHNGNSMQFFISNQPAAQRLMLNGDPNANLDFDQWYTGAGAFFQPVNNAQLGKQDIIASAEEPFGYQFIRYTTMVHRDDVNPYTPNNTGNNDDNYGKGLLEFWMVEDNNGTYKFGDSFDNFAFFYDKAFNHLNVNNRSNNVWGYFDQYERDYSGNLAWTNMTDIDGVSLDPNLFRVQYSWPPNSTNTNALGVKMVHSGSRIVVYLNLNPLEVAGLGVSDSWCKFADFPVAWSNKVSAYFAAESPTPEGNGGGPIYNYTTTYIGNFLVRTVSSNITALIAPTNVVTGSLVNFLLVLTNTMGSINESGIGEIAIKKPSSYLSNWILTNVFVTNQYGALAATNRNFNPPLSMFSLSTNPAGEMVIRFNATSSTTNQLVTNSTSVITVSFSLWTPANANSAGDNFEVYADCVKHFDTAKDIVFDGANGLKYATTGRKKAYSINNSLLVKAFGQPSGDGLVNVSAIPYYQGQASATFTYKIDTSRNTNSPDISSVAIVIPDIGFTVLSNFNSKILGPVSSNYMYFTNYLPSLALSNCIYIDYAGAGKSIAGINGSDKLNFDVFGTAALPINVKLSNYQWKSYVNSSAFISGTTWQQTTNTNAGMGLQFITLIAKSPALAGNITPFSVSINSAVVSNAIANATYTIVNQGLAGNDLYLAMVEVPPEFTNVTAVRSSWLGANTNTSTFRVSWTNLQSPSNLVILVSYTNVSTNFRLFAGSNDVLTFNTIHMITNLDTNMIYKPWFLYGDNANTEGFMPGVENLPQLWGMWITPPMPAGQNQVLDPVIDTSASTDVITNVIWNTSPLGVNIKMSKIVLPVWFTNIVSVTSTHVSNTNQNILVTNVNGTNVVYLYYLGTNGTVDGNGLLQSVNANPTNPDYDKVVIHAMDKIDWDSFTNTNYQLTNLVIQTVVFKTNVDVSDTNFYSNCTTGAYSQTNYVAVQYPRVSAAYMITTNVIDSTTITNTLYYTISNTGDYGNRIKKVYITIDPAAVSNIVSASSTLLGDITGNIDSNIITVDYASGSQILWGNNSDLITFVLVSKIVGTKYGPFSLNPLVQNDRETATVTNVIPGGSGTLLFDIPKPSGAAGIYPNMMYTGTNVNQTLMVIVSNTGQGTDKFQKAQVVFPASLSNAVVQASSQWLGKNSISDPTFLVLTASNLLVIYTNNMIPVGSNDIITLQLTYSNLSVGQTNNWWIGAYNGYKVLAVDYYQQLTNTTIGDTNTYFTEMPTANIVPNVALTTDLSNTFSVTVRNGTNALNRSIQRVKVDIPYPYQSAGMNIGYNSGKGFSSFVSNNSIYLNYGTNFIGSAYSSFDINSAKNYIFYPTNVDWTSSVYYNGESDGFKGITASGTNSVTVSIALPNSQAYAYVSPQTISKDVAKNDFSITVSNFGVFGNDIQLVEIIPPNTNNYTNIFTNINNLSNTVGGTLIYTNGVVLVQYFTANTNISSDRKDTIFFTGYDNQNLPGYSGQWNVYVGNTTNTNSLVQAQVLLSGDLDFQVIQPGYRSDYRVSPNVVDTSLYRHTFTVLVNNSGSAGNDVKVVRMLLPQPYITNGIVLNSALATGNLLTNYNGTNAIEFTYNSNVFITGTNDTITVSASNSLSLGDTNIWIRLSANYYSSAQTYLDSLVQVGTNIVQFQMPQANVQAFLATNEVYTTHKKFGLAYRFVNNGLGSNKVRQAWVTVPALFTNSYASILVSGKVSNTNMAGNVLSIYYTNFNSGDTDTVVFNFTNTVTNDFAESNVYFDAKFYNGEYTNTGTASGPYDMFVNIVTPPSASVSPLTALSTDYTNHLQVYYKNNSSGVLPTTALRIDLPAVYTNIQTAVSSNGTAFISNMSVYVTNYNAGSGLAKNSLDYVSIVTRDNINNGYVSNISWSLYADNGTGLGKARETISGTLNQNLVMPEPNLEAYLNTSWFYVSTNAAVNSTNTMQITLINHGVDANSVRVVKIALPLPPASPHPFTNVIASSITSTLLTNIAASVKVYSNELYVYYTNELPNGLQSSQTDTITFNIWYLILDSGTYPVNIYGNNGSLSGYVQSFNVAPTTTLLSLNLPQQKSELYLSANSTIYTLDTNNVIGYKVNNNSYSFDLKSVFIPFDTNILSANVRIASAWLSNTNVAYSFTNVNSVNGLLVDYGAKPVPKRSFDDLDLYVAYGLSAQTNMNMSGLVRYAGSAFYEDTLVPTGSTAVLNVKVADFGRVYGYVLPGYLNTGVKVVQTNSDVIVTNKFGTNIATTADTNGYFLIDYVPEGKYDIVLYSSKYKDIRLASCGVLSNAVTNVETNIMRHSPLNPRDTVPENIQSQSDSQTVMTVYPNTILSSFSLDIWLTNMFDSAMQVAVNSSKTVAKPVDATTLNMYFMEMKDANGLPLDDQPLTNDALMQFHFTDAEITAQNWNKSKLAVYYWRPMNNEWVRIGGAVDTTADTVTIKASYIHKYYAILGEDANMTKAATGFVSVRTDPKVFTPRSGNSQFKNMKISIGFDGVVDKYTVKIYNMRGGLVKSYDRTGTYGAGEVYWDGKDDEGYDVKGGIYVFRITAGANAYSGTIVIVR